MTVGSGMLVIVAGRWVPGREKRLKFEALREPWTPEEHFYLDPARIHRIARAEKVYYILYETEKKDFYAYFSKPLPKDAQELDKLEYSTLICAKCGREAEWDADEPYCPKHGDEYLERRTFTVWTRPPQAAPWEFGAVLQPPPIERAIVTPFNVRYYAEQLLPGARHGHFTLAGHLEPYFVRVVREEQIGPFKVREGPGWLDSSSWDEVPEVSEPGYYISYSYQNPPQYGGGFEIFFKKIRDLTEDEKREFVSTRPDVAELLIPELAEQARRLIIKQRLEEVKRTVERGLAPTPVGIKDVEEADDEMVREVFNAEKDEVLQRLRELQELEKKREEEERRRLEEERKREEEVRRREERAEILGALKGLPVEVEERGRVVKVRVRRGLSNEEFYATIAKLKEMGFRFIPGEKVWVHYN